MFPFRHRLFLSLMALRFGLVPLIFGGVFARVHDNLDSALVYNVLSARFWRGGLDHAALDVHLNGVLDWTHFATLTWPLLLPYMVLPPAWAYTVTEFGIVVLAYAGMYLLVRDVQGHSAAAASPDPEGERVAALMSCLFAMTLGFSTLGLGLAAAPLLVLLALRGGGVLVWVVMFLIGWNSSLVGHAIFLPPVVLAVAFALNRDWRPAVVPLIAYVAGAVLGSLPLFAHVLGDYQDHRSIWAAATPVFDPVDAIGNMVAGLLSQGIWYHATITPALYTAVFLVAGLVVRRGVALVVLGVVLGALALNVAAPWLGQILPGVLASIQFDRIGQFSAFLVILLGALVLQARPSGRSAKWVRGAAVVTLVQAMLVWSGINLATLRAVFPQEQRAAIRADAARDGWRAALSNAGITPRSFFDAVPTVPRHMRSADYACIAEVVGRAAVASAGPDPMLAPLHGIRALDGYHYLYPASWHTAFRPVIADKIEASPELRAYYDMWGNRVSLFVDRVPEVSPDYAALRALGAGFVIADRPLPLEEITPECALSGDLRLYRL